MGKKFLFKFFNLFFLIIFNLLFLIFLFIFFIFYFYLKKKGNPNKRPEFTEIVERLESIIVDCAISDEDGNKFWKKYFPKQEKVFFFLYYFF